MLGGDVPFGRCGCPRAQASWEVRGCEGDMQDGGTASQNRGKAALCPENRAASSSWP